MAVIGNDIYVLGGRFFLRNLRYNPTFNSGDQIADSPYGHSNGGAGVIDGKIYLVGGTTVDQNADQNRIQAYNPSTNSWTVGSAMPTQRDGVAVAAANGRLYVFGGRNSGTLTNIVEEYNPATNSWTRKADMPTARAFASAAVVNGIIYVIGGHQDGFYSFKVEAYDPSTNTWSAKEELTTRRSLTAVAVLRDKIYVMAGLGMSDPRTLSTVEEFDPQKPDLFPFPEAWTTKSSLRIARYGAVAGVVNDKIYVIGGSNVETGAEILAVEEGSPSSGSGNGTVSYSVAANTTTSSRSGMLTIAGQTFTVTQAPPDTTPPTYLVGNVSPAGNDLNGDGDTDDAGEFGNESLTTVDLILALRAVTNLPGWRPPACSDRFDAMDSSPADTTSTRGGNATLTTVDLIITLRRVTGIDTSRPRRPSRSLPCPP